LDADGGTTPVIYAEENCWGSGVLSSRFSLNVDYVPNSNFCLLDPGPKIVTGGDEGTLPRQTELLQNYPNPFNPATRIQFNLERPEKVRLEVYNILGQKVRTMLAGEEFGAGPYTFSWDGRDDRGVAVSSGTYFYQLQTPSFRQSKKMNLVK
jgi:hypothetical protein